MTGRGRGLLASRDIEAGEVVVYRFSPLLGLARWLLRLHLMSCPLMMCLNHHAMCSERVGYAIRMKHEQYWCVECLRHRLPSLSEPLPVACQDCQAAWACDECRISDAFIIKHRMICRGLQVGIPQSVGKARGGGRGWRHVVAFAVLKGATNRADTRVLTCLTARIRRSRGLKRTSRQSIVRCSACCSPSSRRTCLRLVPRPWKKPLCRRRQGPTPRPPAPVSENLMEIAPQAEPKSMVLVPASAG